MSTAAIMRAMDLAAREQYPVRLPAACPASDGVSMVRAGRCWGDASPDNPAPVPYCGRTVTPDSRLGLCKNCEKEIIG